MKACFQIAECSFAFAKILQKSEIAKRFATFFILSPIFSCEIKIFIVSLQMQSCTRQFESKLSLRPFAFTLHLDGFALGR